MGIKTLIPEIDIIHCLLFLLSEENPCENGQSGCHEHAECMHTGPASVRTINHLECRIFSPLSYPSSSCVHIE